MTLPRLSPSARLVALAFTLAAGERAAFAVPAAAPLWPLAAFALAVAALALYARGGLGRTALFPSVFALGALLAFRTDARLADLLADNAREHGERPPLTLTVEEDARPQTTRDGLRRWSFRSSLGPLALRVVLPPDTPRPVPGERWTVDGFIARPRAGQSRFAERALWVSADPAPRRAAAAGRWSREAVYARCAARLLRQAALGLDWCPDLAELNAAVLLGRRTGLPREKREIFSRAGTVHVFAISGLHVMMIALFLRGALKRFDVPLPARNLLVIPLLAAYTVLTGARPSAVRAALMVTFALLAPAFGRRPDGLGGWAVTALLVYARAPERIFDLGCTLSFAVMFGIVLYLDRADARGDVSQLRKSAGVSFASWAAGVPVVAAVFGRVTPGALLANTAVIRYAKVLVGFGIGGLAAGSVCPLLGAVCNNIAVCCTAGMAQVSVWTARLPFACLDVTPWDIPLCAAWYLACAALFAAAARAAAFRPRAWWRRVRF